MVTLATAVNSSATTWALSAALPAGTDYIQVDDELVAVITPAIRENQREHTGLTCEVLRGVAGEQASHSQGATLTTLPNPPLGGGSGEQTMTLLGPFPITFETAGLINPSDNGVELGPTIEAGAVIVSAWMAATGTGWSATGEHWHQVSFGSAASARQIVTFDGADNPGQNAKGHRPFPLSPIVAANYLPFVTAQSGKLVVSWNDLEPDSQVSGVGSIYALIAEPAA